MFSTFYIMKVDKKKINMEQYYSNIIEKMPSHVSTENSKRKTKCRVCLQDGELPVTSVTNPQDYEEALNVFADIVFDENSNATYLCYVCYKFLKTSILFRRVAHQANEILKQSFLKQSPDYFEDFLDYDLLDSFEHVKKHDVKIIPNTSVKREVPETRRAGERSKKVTCQICNKVMNESYYLKTHLLIHNDRKVKCKGRKCRPGERSKKVTCQICNKVMNELYYLNKHLLLHNDLGDPHVCDICGKSFKLKHVMANHMKRHDTGHTFKCQLCPYTAKYKDYLKRHMPIHSGELKYLCTECPARYMSKSRLKEHIKLKHTEPTHKCDTCHKAYHSSLMLQRHIEAAHLGIRKHECDLCAMAFSYRKDFLRHQRRAHKIPAMRRRFNTSKTFEDNCSEVT